MYLCYLLIFVWVVCDGANFTNNTKPRMLQIGIKKRIENCTVKSKKGDLLHLHYKVFARSCQSCPIHTLISRRPWKMARKSIVAIP